MPREVVIRLQAITNTPVQAERDAELAFRVGPTTVAVASGDFVAGRSGYTAGDVDYHRVITAQVTKPVPEEIERLLDRHASLAKWGPEVLTKSGEGEPFAFVELTDEELDAIEAMESAPNELLDFFQPITTELLAAASRVVQTMRWVLNLTSSGRPVSAPHFSWSYDAQEWWPVSAHDSPINPLGEGDVVILSSTTGVVQAVLGREGFGEPLGRQLLYEAVDLLEANPRAALVLAIVAAEVGLKDFAGGGAPERTWLLSEVATPPIVKMIREYLPILTDTRTHDGRVMPKAMTSTLQRGVERRNEIVHRGLDAPDEEDLRELIETVNDFLYALDWLAGHKWAFGRMREETQREWR